MNSVFYLSYSDIADKEGLVFPSELQQATYSPGIWTVCKNKHMRLPNEFSFDAVDNIEVVNLKLSQVNGNVYSVNTEKYGMFFFRISHIFFRYEKYVGDSKLIDKSDRLYQVYSMNIQHLSKACLENRFYFVGRIDNNLEQRRELK